MSEEVEQREALAAFIDQAEMGHIPGANVTEHWTDRVAYAVMHSDWLRDYVAARVASAAAERDQAVAVADSMQHFADVAEVCERKSNEYAAENAALRARLDEVRALHVPDSSGDWCDHCWTGPDAHGNGPGPAWPCATIRALDPVLAAAHDEGSEQR